MDPTPKSTSQPPPASADLPVRAVEKVESTPFLSIPSAGRGIGNTTVEIAKALKTELPDFSNLPVRSQARIIDAFKPGGLLNIGDLYVAKNVDSVLDSHQVEFLRRADTDTKEDQKSPAKKTGPIDECKLLDLAAMLRQPVAVIQAALEVSPDARSVAELKEALTLVQILVLPSNRRELEHLNTPPPLDHKTIDTVYLAGITEEAIRFRNFLDDLQGNCLEINFPELLRLLLVYGSVDEMENSVSEVLESLDGGEAGFWSWYNDVTGLNNSAERKLNGPARSRKNRFKAE